MFSHAMLPFFPQVKFNNSARPRRFRRAAGGRFAAIRCPSSRCLKLRKCLSEFFRQQVRGFFRYRALLNCVII